MKRMGSSLVFCWPVLVAVAISCSDNGELFGSREAGGAGAGQGGGAGAAGTGMVPGSGGASGGAGSGGFQGTGGLSAGSTNGGATVGGAASGTGGVIAGSSAIETGGRVGTGGRSVGGAGAQAGMSGTSTNGGSGGKQVASGGLGGAGGAGAGSAGESNAGSGGAAGGSATCPTACKSSPLASACSSGETTWECGAGYKYQEMVDAGCRDLATAIQRFCCPAEAFSACTSGTACGQVTTQAECDARTDCHSVFTDPHNCGCAAIGCCARFSRCADGALANCNDSNVSCDAATPYCESPAYVVSYSGFCYEGCVRAADCAP